MGDVSFIHRTNTMLWVNNVVVERDGGYRTARIHMMFSLQECSTITRYGECDSITIEADSSVSVKIPYDHRHEVYVAGEYTQNNKYYYVIGIEKTTWEKVEVIID